MRVARAHELGGIGSVLAGIPAPAMLRLAAPRGSACVAPELVNHLASGCGGMLP
jgi:hypothetical protein